MENDEILCLINIFRFVTKEDEANLITQPSKSAPTISCLDLGPKLIHLKDDGPWTKLQQVLFERLMIEDYNECREIQVKVAISKDNDFKFNDSQILRYLYGCFYRMKQTITGNDKRKELLQKAESLILDQVVLYLTEPDLFPDRDKRRNASMLFNLVKNYHQKSTDIHLQNFVNSTAELICKTLSEPTIDDLTKPIYEKLLTTFANMTIDEPMIEYWFGLTQIFLQQPDLAKKLFDKNILKMGNSLTYQSTLLGFMLCISPLPKTNLNDITFFKNPITFGESNHKFIETQLGVKLQLLGKELHNLFLQLLKVPTIKKSFLSWIGRCLYTFKDRNKLWSNQLLMQQSTISVNDGFLMNFLTVMLHLSEPFAGPYNLNLITRDSFDLNKKMLKIDPRYCLWSETNHENSSVNFLGLGKETFLINTANTTANQPQSTAAVNAEIQPNFITECFFGTHQAFSYGFRSLYERFFKLAQSINELQHAFQEDLAQSTPNNQERRELIRSKIDGVMTLFLNIKAVLMVPDRVRMQLHFCVATASYLNHLVACQNFEEANNATCLKQITLDSLREQKTNRACLEYIPEMLIENIIDFFIFLKHFNEQAMIEASGMMEPIMTLIITFMGNSSLMQNPHLRARFAEILECFMPHQSSFNYGNKFFSEHPLSNELTTSLVNVFVSIEMTGEGVQFEQKFSYRRPMYIVLEYLWNMQEHRRRLIQLAEEAEANIDSARPPLFLRFINLLMNDAIFLLDEALNYMNQLREFERRTKTDDWKNLNPQQRHQAESSNHHTGRLARFHNVLSQSTIGTLAWITSEIKTIFSHSTLVDRIANMLNYFLEHLVGPKKGKFNVNDKNDYEFKPREILAKICQIYINLGLSDSNEKYREFCTAVSSDGRSYSKNLLPQATDILFRTGMSSLGTEFEKLSQQIQEIAIRNQMDEIDDIPDTFLDPIMSTLMVDPVLLPSSKIIVDRSTIARHLLSDQTDPFNRSPLSMEDVIPDIDLKTQIENFLKDKRKSQNQFSTS